METRNNLFLCDQTFTFFNMLVLRQKQLRDEKVDLLISDKAGLTRYVSVLSEMNIFDNIIVTEKAKYCETEVSKASYSDKIKYYKSPHLLLDDFTLNEKYTDIWINIENEYAIMVFYLLKSKGAAPRVHLVQEGVANYTREVSENRVNFHSNLFHGDSFFAKIADNYVYSPELYIGDPKLAVKVIDRSAMDDEEFRERIVRIFGECSLPEEKFIFLETPLLDMGILTNEFELFEKISSQVGNDNIIIKRHPRNKIDRFSALGYKVMPDTQIPWEILVYLNRDKIKDKVLVSIFSQTCFSPKDVFAIDAKVIFLKDVVRHHIFWYEKPSWKKYFSNAMANINKDGQFAFNPGTPQELELILKYHQNF